MEKNYEQPKENLPVVLPVDVYINASTLELTQEEQIKLMAPFADDEYEIRPDGFIYIPQALIKRRLNEVIGVGQWALVKVHDRYEQVKEGRYRMYFDGALMIRGKFASRSVGESVYNQSNENQSWASALEAAKSDTIVRCSKDLGIASEVHQPAFCRKWQKSNAVKVWISKEFNGKTKNEIAWRRKDVDPFFNETGIVQPTGFKVPGSDKATGHPQQPSAGQQQSASDGLPWLNHGPDYNKVVAAIEAGTTTLEAIRKEWRLSKPTTEAIIGIIHTAWKARVNNCKNLKDLTALYNKNDAEVSASPDLIKIFTARRDTLKTVAA